MIDDSQIPTTNGKPDRIRVRPPHPMPGGRTIIHRTPSKIAGVWTVMIDQEPHTLIGVESVDHFGRVFTVSAPGPHGDFWIWKKEKGE